MISVPVAEFSDRSAVKFECPTCHQAGIALLERDKPAVNGLPGKSSLVSLSNGFHAEEASANGPRVVCDHCNAPIGDIGTGEVRQSEPVAGRSPQRSEEMAGDETHGFSHLVTQETEQPPVPPKENP